MNEEQSPRNLLLVGAGGIGTQLSELLVAALRRVGLQGTITLMDADTVEASNLGHQRFTEDDIGQPKVTCLLYTSPSPRDATLSRMPSSA